MYKRQEKEKEAKEKEAKAQEADEEKGGKRPKNGRGGHKKQKQNAQEQAGAKPLSDYEIKRLETMEQNKQWLAFISATDKAGCKILTEDQAVEMLGCEDSRCVLNSYLVAINSYLIAINSYLIAACAAHGQCVCLCAQRKILGIGRKGGLLHCHLLPAGLAACLGLGQTSI